ncbi:MAG TPA: hypothetical protein VH280_15390 [Verrucomicrobiae bacterium]|jgi:hypothetical protein|nr:hypothetical protein [Verrucomicrobiae bacterium]
MSFRVIHDTEAAFEFREAVAWYESQSEGLGIRFTLEVNRVIAVWHGARNPLELRQRLK